VSPKPLPPAGRSAVPRPRIHGLDTLRAAAILLVFMYHYMCFISGEATFGWASTAGWVGVDLFFVLSGYLIANQLFAGLVAGRELSLNAFYTRRLLRTLPNYYVVLALYFLFPLAMPGKTPPPLWQFLTFTQNILLHPGTAFSHAWSLCVEEQFYLVLPAAVLLAAYYGKKAGTSIRLAWVLLAALVVAGIALRTVLWWKFGRIADGAIDRYYPNVYYGTLCRGDEFLPGVAIALLRHFHPATWQRLMQRGRLLLSLAIAGTIVLGYLLLKKYYIDGYGYGFFMSSAGYSLVAMCFGLWTLAALSPASGFSRLRVPGAAQLALWSYAIYLSHRPVTSILAKLLTPYGIVPGSWTAVALLSLASLVCGFLLYRFVETPFMRLRDRICPSNFAAAPLSALPA
jgi:peptidoglycan/LPS O-acetylase OafA/YrhL